MKRPRSPYTCIGDSTGDLRQFDMTVRCAALYAGATLNQVLAQLNRHEDGCGETAAVYYSYSIGLGSKYLGMSLTDKVSLAMKGIHVDSNRAQRSSAF